jgi:hypothetical protein
MEKVMEFPFKKWCDHNKLTANALAMRSFPHAVGAHDGLAASFRA